MKTTGLDELIAEIEAGAEKDLEVKKALEESRAWAKQVIENLLKELPKRYINFSKKYFAQSAQKRLKLFRKNYVRRPHPHDWCSVEKTGHSRCLGRYPRSEKLVGWHKQRILASRIGV